MVSRRDVTYVSRQGHRISRTTWQTLSARPDYVVIASSTVNVGAQQVHVMTIWLGLVLPGSEPQVFETLVHYPGDRRPHRWLSSTAAEAEQSHAHVVEHLARSPRLDRSTGTADLASAGPADAFAGLQEQRAHRRARPVERTSATRRTTPRRHL